MWVLHALTDASSNSSETNFLEILKGRVIELRLAGWVLRITLRYDNHHPLSGASEKNAICILLIAFSVCLVNIIPAIASEGSMLPTTIGVSEIRVPRNACPIEFKSLHMKFRGHIL